MTTEKLTATDQISSGLTCNLKAGEEAKATGLFEIKCHDKDGNLKWEAQSKNLVVNVGLQYMAGTALTSVAQITTWYLGLYGAGASNTPAAADTMSSHAGWTEFVEYSGQRKGSAGGSVAFGTATTADPSVISNSASPSVFAITGVGGTVAGAFLTTIETKSTTTGTLFSVGNFTAGDKLVTSGDTLNVTYTFSADAT